MSEHLHTRIERIKAKALVISEKCAKLRQEAIESRGEIARLENELRVRDRTIEELERKIEFMAIVDNIGSIHGGDTRMTRSFLEELVREIDKCIAEISD